MNTHRSIFFYQCFLFSLLCCLSLPAALLMELTRSGPGSIPVERPMNGRASSTQSRNNTARRFRFDSVEPSDRANDLTGEGLDDDPRPPAGRRISLQGSRRVQSAALEARQCAGLQGSAVVAREVVGVNHPNTGEGVCPANGPANEACRDLCTQLKVLR